MTAKSRRKIAHWIADIVPNARTKKAAIDADRSYDKQVVRQQAKDQTAIKNKSAETDWRTLSNKNRS